MVYHLILAVPANYAPATVVNTATITSAPATDPTPANNAATDTDTVTKSADLAIAKTDGVASVVAGTSTTYTITVTNNGPSDEPAGVVVSDPIPAGTNGSESEPDCAIAAGHVHVHDLGADRSRRVRSLSADAGRAARLADRQPREHGSITSAPVGDPNVEQLRDRHGCGHRSADLSISKTDSVASVTAGTSITYTITVTNLGPSAEPTVSWSTTRSPVAGRTRRRESERGLRDRRRGRHVHDLRWRSRPGHPRRTS